jgi:hypothetical protein
LYHVHIQELRAAANSILDANYPKDSIRALVKQSAAQWSTHVQRNPVHGMQLDSYGQVSVAAGQEALAQQQFSARLATPGLTLNDKAYTYMTAVFAFASEDKPEHLPVAERYLTALEAMGSAAAFWQHTAHRSLAHTYYVLGQTGDVVRHGLRAIELIEKMEFVDRLTMYSPAGAKSYAEIIDALSGQPNARARIDTVNAALERMATPSAALLAKSPECKWQSEGYAYILHQMMATSRRIGTRAEDVEGNYWVNMPSSAPQTMSMANGKIHVLIISNYTCEGCLIAMARLQYIQDKYPSIQCVTATWTVGAWANRLVEPEEEVEKLREAYTGRLKIRYPISIWKGEKKLNDDGGMTPEDGGPNLEHYPLTSKPNIYVVDGKGIIRRVYITFDQRDEAPLANFLDFLQREAGHNGGDKGPDVSHLPGS